MSLAADLIRSVLPNGGYVVTWRAYFDESGTDEESEWIVLAGYMFDDKQFVELDAKWKSMLDSHRDSDGKTLPFFHMSSCAHNQKVFKRFTRDQCDIIAREAIGLIVDHMSYGFAVSIEKRFAHLIPTGNLTFSAYSFACWQCLMAIRKWADTENYRGDVLYFFEQGHDSEHEADKLMIDIFKQTELQSVYRSSGHGFYDKRKVRPLQCADILAWQWLTHSKRMKREGISDPRGAITSCRKDFGALVKHNKRYNFQIYDEKQIRALKRHMDLNMFREHWRHAFWGLTEQPLFDLPLWSTLWGKDS
jgi:uncharacterized protein DUF3800